MLPRILSIRLALWIVLAACVLTAPLAAQTVSTASLRGTLTDASGAAVASARVVVRHVPTGAQVQTQSDEQGRYQITGLRPGGPYTVRVTMLGYAPAERSGLELALAGVSVQNFRLNVQATLLEEVTVAVGADQRFSTSRTGSATLLDEAAIQAHPTIERDFVEIAEVSPMVTTTQSGALSISGQNERYNSITINGALHQDVFGAYASGVPGAEARAKAMPLDALQEFQIQVAPYDVRSSGFTGGLLNAVTKSGTNEWRGSILGQFRDERFFGDLPLDGTNYAPADYEKQVYAASIGGPIVRDRLHVFLAGEGETRREPPSGYSLGVGDPYRTRVTPDSAARIAAVLNDVYGFDAGRIGRYGLENPSLNLFGRLDWRISGRHSLTVHENFVRATRDVTPNRAPTGAYEFSSATYRARTTTSSMMAQLESRFGDRWYNELRINVQRTRDEQDPLRDGPLVEVNVQSDLDGTLLGRAIRAGSNYLAQQNDLTQDVLQVSDALSWSRGDVTTTFGGAADFFRFDYDFLPGSRGFYRFGTIDSLEANRAGHYEVQAARGGGDASVRVSVVQPAAYVQNEHAFPGGLRLYYGIRAEVPVFLGRPEYNPVIEDVFGLRNDRLPSGTLLVSPRVGFNWQSEGAYTTQFRGGFGVFTGRLPYVWLANAHANTGLHSTLLTCDGENVPALDFGGATPLACTDGTTAEEARNGVAVLFDEDFQYPRELKTSLALDQELPFGFVASGEVLLVQTLRQVIVRDINLSPGAALDRKVAETVGPRVSFGIPIAPTGYVQRRVSADFTHVLVMENEKTSGFAHAVTLGLERGFGRALTIGGSHSFNHADDRQSLQSGQTLLNFAYSPAGSNPNQPARAPSYFERPWKTVVYARGRLPAVGTQLSVIYIGQAGSTYSYVYANDANGDGYPGLGMPLDFGNDLIYVPRTGGGVPGSLLSGALMEQLKVQEPCLAAAAGRIMTRNACRGPASHRVDLKVVQPVRLGGSRAEVSASLVNAANLLDDGWGRVYDVPAQVPLLALDERMERPGGVIDPRSQPSLRYVGAVRRDAESGLMRATLPYVLNIPESQWQAQVGVQFYF